MKQRLHRHLAATALFLATQLLSASSFAESSEIVIGINLSLTGAASTLGVPQRRALQFVPAEIGGVRLKLVVLDDKTDRWASGVNARQLASESKADVLIGASTTPASLAVALVAGEFGIPQIAVAPMSITPARRKWSVVATQPTALMARALYQHMIAHDVKRVAYFGYAEPYGDLWFNDLDANSEALGLRVVEEQRFARTDLTVSEQVRRLQAAHPDAILVGASGAVAALPQSALRNAGYQGLIYQTQGAAGPEFLRAAGATAEGTILPAPPLMDAENLADSSPVKKVALAFVGEYEAKSCAATRNVSAAHVYDAFEILRRVLPVALRAAKPGTPEFRDAVRHAFLVEHDIAGSSGVYNFTETDRYGQDGRSCVLLTVKEGKFVAVR